MVLLEGVIAPDNKLLGGRGVGIELTNDEKSLSLYEYTSFGSLIFWN